MLPLQRFPLSAYLGYLFDFKLGRCTQSGIVGKASLLVWNDHREGPLVRSKYF